MPKATLNFNLPEESPEFNKAVHASEAFDALYDMAQYIRGEIKYKELGEAHLSALEACQSQLYIIIDGYQIGDLVHG